MERNGVYIPLQMSLCPMHSIRSLLLPVPLGQSMSSMYFYSWLKTWKDCPNSLSISLHNATENYSDDGNNFKAARKKILNEQQLQENNYSLPSRYQAHIFPLLIISYWVKFFNKSGKKREKNHKKIERLTC